MRRNPMNKAIEEYMQGIKVKKIHPRLTYHRCEMCGYEYKKEPMWEARVPLVIFEGHTRYYIGCQHCFQTRDEFRKYLEERGKIYTEESFKNDRWLRAMYGNAE